jgi:asparagine synthase (glutamine-hydrolysing)
MDGELVSRGYIDRTSLAAALSQDPAVGQAYVRIMALLDMEAWIAHWQKHGV